MRTLEQILSDLKQAKRAYIDQWDDSNGAELLTPGFARWWESVFAPEWAQSQQVFAPINIHGQEVPTNVFGWPFGIESFATVHHA